MEINEKQEEQAINCGVFGYNAQRIANILGFAKEVVDRELNDKNSELNKLLEKGRDMSDYVIDLKLFEMSKTGDLKALDKLNTRKKDRIRFEKTK